MYLLSCTVTFIHNADAGLYFFLSLPLQGNLSDAISCYNEVLRIDPMAADALVNRGNTYKESGRVNEAIQDYIRAINIRPAMAEAHANLASAYKDRYLILKCSYFLLYVNLIVSMFVLSNILQWTC